MRGTKAKKLRKAGLKSGPAERTGLNDAEKKIAEAKKPYSETKHIGVGYGFSKKVRENIFLRRLESSNNDNV